MGHKKKNSAPRSKLSEAASPVAQVAAGGAAVDGVSLKADPCLQPSDPNNLNLHNHNRVEVESGAVVESESLSFSAVKLECERALNALRRGNHTRALKVMKEACLRHENSALIHRVQGTVCVKVASIIDDSNTKQRHLRNAIESSHKAIELSPNSIEFAHFYANLLYEAANEGKEYEEVVQECERALGIENPIDPAKESLQDESQQKISTAEARIAHVQNELRQLIQKSNIASLSTWMKNFGNGEEKFRLIPIRRVAEDPMEVKLAQAKRPNEIKKANKTPEERRKEIEVRVAAARLLQQKSETSQIQNDGDKSVTPSGSGQRSGERRKHSNFRKQGSSAERKDRVQLYWKSLSIDSKKDLLRVKISNLKGHYNSSKDGSAAGVLSESLSFCEANKSWRFWVCCRCCEKFADSECHMQHVVQEHMGNLLPKMQSVIPKNVDNEWIEIIHSSPWKPLDASASVKMITSKKLDKEAKVVEDVCLDSHTEDCENYFKDEWDSSPEKGSSENSCIDNNLEGNKCGKKSDTECENCHEGQGSQPDSWPVSDDSDRSKLLERIHAIFELLISHKYLADSHLKKVIQFTMDELMGIPSGSYLLNHGVDQTPICICFLGALQLKKILKYLQELSHSCGLGRYSENSISCITDVNNGKQVIETKDKIVFNGEGSYLLLDGCLMSDDCLTNPINNTAADNFANVISSKSENASSVLHDVDAILSYIFFGPSSEEELASWLRTKEEKIKEGMEILQMLEKEFYHLQSLCERKCEHLSYEGALQAVEDLCLEEGKKRENVTDFVHQSHESVLRKRREELIQAENDVMFLGSRFELDALTNVLKEAEALNTNQFGYEESYAGLTSQWCDLDSGEDDYWRAKDYLHQVDTCIEVAIQRQKEQLSVEISKIDARIMKNVTEMQHLELKLEPVCANDYQSILLPLVKSYLRAHLEDLAEKDATEKSDAAREAFLAELELDSKKAVRRGNDNLRHSQEKTKDKKKHKESKKTKDSKTFGGCEQDMLHRETSVQGSFSLHSDDGDVLDSDAAVSENADGLKLQEEEFRPNIELEAEERKLEETLEYQRRIEEEAKQKHLAEQHKKSAQTYPDDSVAEQFVGEDACLEKYEGLPMNGSPMPLRLCDTLDVQNLSDKQGLPNGTVFENCLPPNDRRSGKKGRRSKGSSKLVNEQNQTGTSDKDNCNLQVGISQLDNHVKEQEIFHGNPLSEDVTSTLEDNGKTTLSHVQVEDDDETYQADLKKAVLQSLDAFNARHNLPVVSGVRTSSGVNHIATSSSDVNGEIAKRTDVFGTGLQNEVGEYNCFLNVIIQSLWHLRFFRDEFLRRSTIEHVHVGDPCVVCALYEIFTSLSIASTDTSHREPVAPTSLRMALSNLYPDSSFFQEGQMNDASEVLAVIFSCLHQAFTSTNVHVSNDKPVERNNMGSWDCANDVCLVHSIFGMDIFERMNCYSCGLESRHLKYTSFFHNINASALRTTKVLCGESSFDELLNVVEMNHQVACDVDAGGCGKLNYIHHFLAAPPHVFTTVLGWQNTCESVDDIKATLSALSTEIEIGALYRGLDPKNTQRLVSVVCYYGQHYHCFAYSHDHKCWIMYDDRTVKVIGSWAEVLSMCERGHLQPQVLFFEAVN